MAFYTVNTVLILCVLYLVSWQWPWPSNSRLPTRQAESLASSSDTGPVRILFHTNRCSFRGHDAATFDYAFFGEIFYQIQAYHTFPQHAVHSQSQWNKLESFFPARVVPLMLADGQFWQNDSATYGAALDAIVTRYHIQYLYKIEDGTERNLISHLVPTLVHATGDCVCPHGQRMMAFSLGNSGRGCAASVPLMAWVADCGHENYRKLHGIPDEAIVYGWIADNAPWDSRITEVVKEAAFGLGSKIFFLFQDFPPDQATVLQDVPNILLIDRPNNHYFRCMLGRTIDVLLYPDVSSGDFGRAAMEVSLLQRPMLVAAGMRSQVEPNTLDNLYVFEDTEDLRGHFVNISVKNIIKADFAFPYRSLSPRIIMSQFNDFFFSGMLKPRFGAPDAGQVVNLDQLAHHQFKTNGLM